jgi:hypothetical protein
MCTGKNVALLLSPLLLLFSVAANAQTCVKVEVGASTEVIVSGRITTHHKLPKDSELRTGDGPWLSLDEPLLAGYLGGTTGKPSYEFCSKFRKIAILAGGEDWKEAEAQITQIRKWNTSTSLYTANWGGSGPDWSPQISSSKLQP